MTRNALLDLIVTSVVQRYDGDLDKHEDPRDGGVTYTPNDTDHIRSLLMELWGALFTPKVLNDAYDQLIEEGAGAWPLAYCEEDLASTKERRLFAIDHDLELIDEREKEIREELQRLATEKQALSAEGDRLLGIIRPPAHIDHL
jgi:hypothetical protein